MRSLLARFEWVSNPECYCRETSVGFHSLPKDCFVWFCPVIHQKGKTKKKKVALLWMFYLGGPLCLVGMARAQQASSNGLATQLHQYELAAFRETTLSTLSTFSDCNAFSLEI